MPKDDYKRCSCDLCSGRISHGEMMRNEQDLLNSHGWYAHMVMDDSDSPTGFNYHTHGFEITADHPDIQMVLPMPPRICHGIAVVIYEQIKKGKKFEPGKEYGRIIDCADDDGPKFKVIFIEVMECDRQVLRAILPDREGHLLARDMTIESPDFALQWTP